MEMEHQALLPALKRSTTLAALSRDCLSLVLAKLDAYRIIALWATGDRHFIAILRATVTDVCVENQMDVFWAPWLLSDLPRLRTLQISAKLVTRKAQKRITSPKNLRILPPTLEKLDFDFCADPPLLEPFISGMYMFSGVFPHLNTLIISESTHVAQVSPDKLLRGLPDSLTHLRLPHLLGFLVSSLSRVPPSVSVLHVHGSTDELETPPEVDSLPSNLESLTYEGLWSHYPHSLYSCLPRTLTSMNLQYDFITESKIRLLPPHLKMLSLRGSFTEWAACIQALPPSLEELSLVEHRDPAAITLDMIEALPRALKKVTLAAKQYPAVATVSVPALERLPPNITFVDIGCWYFRRLLAWSDALPLCEKWPKRLAQITRFTWPSSAHQTMPLPSCMQDIAFSRGEQPSLRMGPQQLALLPQGMTRLKIDDCSGVPFNHLSFLRTLLPLKHLDLGIVCEPELPHGGTWNLPLPPFLESLRINGTFRHSNDPGKADELFSMSLDGEDRDDQFTPSNAQNTPTQLSMLSLDNLPFSMRSLVLEACVVHPSFLLTMLPPSLTTLEVDRLTEEHRSEHYQNIPRNAATKLIFLGSQRWILRGNSQGWVPSK